MPIKKSLSNRISHSTCVGETVEWFSSGTKKSGVIISINLANCDITKDPVFIGLGLNLSNTRISQNISVKDRFLILVERFTGNGLNLKSHYYAASASVVARDMDWELIED